MLGPTFIIVIVNLIGPKMNFGMGDFW